MQIATTIALILLLAAGPALAGTADPDTIVYTVRDGDSLVKVCALHRDRTNHYSLTDLLTDIRQANGLQSNLLRVGQKLRIPVQGVTGGAVVAETVAGGAEVRGIYLTGPACGSSSVFGRVDAFIAAGGNAVVFDAKDIDGSVSYPSSHPLASWGEGRSAPMIPSLEDMVGRFRDRRLYVIARLALFLDGELGRLHPELALHDTTGAVWSERGCAWIDPADPRVRDYLLSMAVELAKAGVDEVQFDYVRFPTNGWQGDWTGDLDGTASRRRAVISDFLAAARDSLAGRGVRISTDLFGIMAWDRVEDLALTGQHVPTIAGLVDVICPMIYPSHFRPGFEGRRRPGTTPSTSSPRARAASCAWPRVRPRSGPGCRPSPTWSRPTTATYVATQIVAAMGAGGSGWCLWNPSCSYGVALDVLPELLRAAAAQPVVADAGAPAVESAAVVRPPLTAAGAAPTDLLTGALVRKAPVRTDTP